jgi:hypothetical protein
MSVVASDGAWSRRTRVAATLTALCARWLPALMVAAIALIERHLVVANTDVSWGLTLAEKVLGGERPYVDFIEVNPPATIYLYLPAILIGRLVGLSPERVMDCVVLAAICGSLWMAGRALRRANLLDRFETARLLAMVMAVVAVLPAQIFAEREHVAVVLFLPMLAVMLVRADAGRPGWGEILVAGIGAGAMMILKPHLALGLAATIAMAAWSARSWSVLVAAENWIALALIAIYGGMVALAFPEFLSEIVPLVRTVYLPVGRSLSTMIVGLPAFPIWIGTLAALAVVRRAERYDRVYGVLVAASVGFAGSFLVQGKGWPYHSYPMAALGLIALACAMSQRPTQARTAFERGAWGLAAGLLAVATFTWMNVATSLASLVEPIRQIKPHPTMLAISHDVAVGHPLVRAIGGTWVGSVGSMFMTLCAIRIREHETLTPAQSARLDRYVALDRALLIDALRRRKPDVVLIDKVPIDWEAWTRADAEIDALLKPYSVAVTTPEMLVLRRNGP